MDTTRLAGRLARGQATAERVRMTDTFDVYSPGLPVKNADGIEVLGFNPEGTVKGYVRGAGRDTETTYVKVANVDRPVLKGGLSIPLTEPVPTAGQRGHGWEYECTAVGSLSDLALLGRRYLVWEVPAKSHATARRLTVVEVTDGRTS